MKLEELLDKIEDRIKEADEKDSIYIGHFKPCCDEETADWAFRVAKRELIHDHEWFKDFLNGEFQDEITEYIADKLKERNQWK